MDASKLRRPQSRVVPGSKHDIVRRNAEQIIQARADGYTWASIAAALGVNVSEAAMRRLAVRTGVIADARHTATSERGSKPRPEPSAKPRREPDMEPVREPGSEPVSEPVNAFDGAGFALAGHEQPSATPDTLPQRRWRGPPRKETP